MITNRMHTRVVVMVHSHISGRIDLSKDVIGLRTSKSTKGPGGVSLELVPRRNFFNLLYPNDMINIYIDPGDGKRGFIRVFLGYIDRIERSESTNENGAVSSSFRIACTDFQKAFERTMIYFNPNLSNRTDLIDAGQGQSLLGQGSALRVRGVRAHGTPADMIENISTILLGFGAQWVLPSSYSAVSSKVVKDNRQRRKNRAKARLPKNLVNSFSELYGDLDLLSASNIDLDALASGSIALNDGVDAVSGADISLEKYNIVKEGSLFLKAYQTNTRGTKSDVYSILDLLDFSFIESAAIDGYISSTAIWQANNVNLISLMKSYSNEIVNELIFDLRPVAKSKVVNDMFLDSCFGAEYSKEADDLGINVEGTDDFPKSVDAITYVPAIVFREYPFSYTEGLDLSKLYVAPEVTGGFNAFGPIFSQREEGKDQYRTIYNYLNVEEIAKDTGTLSPVGCDFTEDSAPQKHLDVVEIRDTDVISSSLGRSDNDLFNFFAMYATDALQKVYKFMLKSFLPIATPVSIARNGLRISEVKTRFANYSRDNLCFGSSAVGSSAIIKNMIRWTLLMDHWNQHNYEYLSGEILLRGMPEIRVGYRLDWLDRKESYYVESVSHTWRYPETLETAVQVSRGQRFDPYPVYIPPRITTSADQSGQVTSAGDVIVIRDNINEQDATVLREISGAIGSKANVTGLTVAKGGGDRGSTGRLADYFQVTNTPATIRAVGGNPSSELSDIENIVDSTAVDTYEGVVQEPNVRAPRDTWTTITPASEDDGIGD